MRRPHGQRFDVKSLGIYLLLKTAVNTRFGFDLPPIMIVEEIPALGMDLASNIFNEIPLGLRIRIFTTTLGARGAAALTVGLKRGILPVHLIIMVCGGFKRRLLSIALALSPTAVSQWL